MLWFLVVFAAFQMYLVLSLEMQINILTGTLLCNQWIDVNRLVRGHTAGLL